MEVPVLWKGCRRRLRGYPSLSDSETLETVARGTVVIGIFFFLLFSLCVATLDIHITFTQTLPPSHYTVHPRLEKNFRVTSVSSSSASGR